MSPNNDVVLFKPEDLGEETPLVKYTPEDLKKMTKSGDWLPRLQLMTSNSEKCKDGKFPVNHYALIEGQNYQDLGAQIDVVVFTWRPKALEIDDEIITNFDPESAEFQRIEEEADVPDSNCMFGPEYLLWLPETKQFCTFFMGSKSARREANNVSARIGMAATLTSKQVQTKKYTWFAPECLQCSQTLGIPDMEDVKKEVNKFNNPPESIIETVEEEDQSKRER